MSAVPIRLPPLSSAPPLPARQLSPLRLQLLKDGADCKNCPMSKNGLPSRPVGTDWPHLISPQVVLVAEAPGRREVQFGRPMIGASGKLLDQACSQSGVIRKELAIANAIACGPIPSHLDEVKAAAARACRPRLIAELRRLKPKVVLAVGAKALEVLAAKGTPGVTVARGSLVPFETDVWDQDQPLPSLFPTLHPAHILRGGDGERQQDGNESKSVDTLYYLLLYDLSKAVRFAKGQVVPWRDEFEAFAHDVENPKLIYHVKLNRNGDPVVGAPALRSQFLGAIEKFYDAARAVGSFAIDTETDGKDSLAANLTAVGVATEHVGFSATWAAIRGVPGAFDLLRRLCEDPALGKQAHNVIFDDIVLRRHGLPLRGLVGDSLLRHHAAFPGLPHKLDQVATQFFVTTPWKAEFRSSSRNLAELVVYNCRDAQAVARLEPVLTKAVDHRKTKKVYEVDRQLALIAANMREVGFYIDRKEQVRQALVQQTRVAYMREHLTGELKAIEDPWRRTLARLRAAKKRKKDSDNFTVRLMIRYAEIAKRDTKPTDIGLFKPNGKMDIVALFEVLRIPVFEYTKKTGLPKTDKQAMEGAALRHPLMRKLLHLREAQKVDATFITGLPVRADGRVHPDWSVTKITGRWGAGKTQNVPYNVPGWPPDTNADGTFKTTPSGDWVCARENPRAQVVAPNVEEILALPKHLVDPIVRARAEAGHGRVLVGADMAQVELRIAGFVSGDPFLLDIFNKGLDPHSIFARECFPIFAELEAEFARAGLKPKADLSAAELHPDLRKHLGRQQKLWKRLRDLAKRGEYGGIYGGAPATIWTALVKDYPEVTLANVEQMVRVILDKMQGVVRWRAKQEELARQNREIREALLGRVRLFPLGNFDPSIVYNFGIQAFAATLIARGIFRFVAVTKPHLVDLERLVFGGILDLRDMTWIADQRRRIAESPWKAPVDLLSNGHDSLLGECDIEDGERARLLLEEAMSQKLTRDGITTVFPAEAGCARDWPST